MRRPVDATAAFAGNGVAHGSGVRPGDERIVELIGYGKRMLFVGRPAEGLFRALQNAVCDIVLVPRGGSTAAVDRVAELCGQVIGRSMSTSRLLAELGDARFEAIVLDGSSATVAGVADLESVLGATLEPYGLVIERLSSLSAAAAVGPVLDRFGLTTIDVEPIHGEHAATNGTEARGGAIVVACRLPREQRDLVGARLRRLEKLEAEAVSLRDAAVHLTAHRDDARARATDLRKCLDEALVAQHRRREEIERVRQTLEDERSRARLRIQTLEAELRGALVAATRTTELVSDLRTARNDLVASAARTATLEQRLEKTQIAVGELETRLALARDTLSVTAGETEVLRTRAERLEKRERELRQLLLDAHQQLLERDEELAAALADRTENDGYLHYRAVVARVRELVDAHVPAEATVAVVSKGDEELLQLGARTAWHLPQTEDGIYVGHHPADGAEAVAHLEALRAGGAQFLVLPGTSWWWLDHYPELAAHLERHHRTAAREENVCLIVDLCSPEAQAEDARGAAYAELVEGVRDLVGRSVPEEATLVVVSRGDSHLLELGNRTAWHLPQGEGGVYAGYHPATSVAAIAQLEAAREQGANFFVLPETQRWWLQHYEELALYLDRHAELVAGVEGVGAVYRLTRRRRW